MESVTEKRVALLHPTLRAELAEIIANIESKGIDIRITQGLRTIAEQDAIYAQGRTKPGKVVSNAKGGQSFHNYGLAVDFCLYHSDGSISFGMHDDMNKDGKADWMQVVDSFKSFGWEWGDRGYVDTPHFQKVFGKTPEYYFSCAKDAEGYPILEEVS